MTIIRRTISSSIKIVALVLILAAMLIIICAGWLGLMANKIMGVESRG
jgi:hypothetical protein